MSTIVDALKTVHPEATGDTIADVIKTISASGGGGDGANSLRVIEFKPPTPAMGISGGFVKSMTRNSETKTIDVEYYTRNELVEMMHGTTPVKVMNTGIALASPVLAPINISGNPIDGPILVNGVSFSGPTNSDNTHCTMYSYKITLQNGGGLNYEEHQWKLSVVSADD